MEKKPESDWEEAERLGPYQIHEQVPQSEHGRGDLYRATHETSGVTALVFKPAAEDEKGSMRLTSWRVRCISSVSPSYLAVEVEHSRWSVAPDRQSVETLVCLLEEVRDGVRRMAQALPVFDEPRPRWHLGLALAGAAAVGALLFALVSPAPVPQPPDGSDSLARAVPSPMGHEVLTDTELPSTGNGLLMELTDGGIPALAHPFPKKPYKGQRRPPCKPRVEVEIMGACWIPHELKAPCPEDLYEYQGKCYTTSMQPPREPQSIEP